MLEKIFGAAHCVAYIVVTLAIGASVIFMITMVPGLGSEKAAAWVQAVGSIAAIIGAYWIGERQAKVALANSMRLQEIAEQKKRLSVFCDMLSRENENQVD